MGKLNNYDYIPLHNESLLKPDPGHTVEDKDIQISSLSDIGVLKHLLNIDDLDEAKTLASRTWSYQPYDWVSSDGVTIAREGECKIALIMLPLVNDPYFRLYSTYRSTISTTGYHPRPYRGGRNSSLGGYLRIDIDFLLPGGGDADGWSFDINLTCKSNNSVVQKTSGNFRTNFYDEVVNQTPRCYPSFRRVIKC